MNSVVDIPPSRVIPEDRDILSALGVPPGREADGRVAEAMAAAIEAFVAEAEPRGLLLEVGTDAFAQIYRGEGRNAAHSPLELIYPRADVLVLFAATVGSGVSVRTEGLFARKELTIAVTLDAVGSAAVELAGDYLDRFALESLREEGATGDSSRALRYSPGYCGWDITGQSALFESLRPERIGIRLNESCLMEPLKSISGVIVVGPPEIHEFVDDFAFCSECRTRECRRRIADLRSARPRRAARTGYGRPPRLPETYDGRPGK